MRREGEVKQKLKQVRFRVLKKFLDSHLKSRPRNCIYNVEMDSVSGKRVGVCKWREYSCEESWKIILCDEEMPEGRKQARTCVRFCPKKDKKELKGEFREFLATEGLGKISFLYPDLAALMWVLELKGSEEWIFEEEETQEEKEEKILEELEDKIEKETEEETGGETEIGKTIEEEDGKSIDEDEDSCLILDPPIGLEQNERASAGDR